MGYLESILGTDEHIVFATRKHWMVIAGDVAASAVLAVVIIAASVIPAMPALRAPTWLSLLLLLFLIIPIGRLVTAYLNWWNEQYLVTNRRIIQIEGVFNKHVIDSSLNKVNDVVMDQSFMGRLLGYGDIEILTASDIGVNKLDKIANPIRFKTTMLNQKEGVESGETSHAQHGPDASETSIPELIAALAELRARGLLTEEEFQAKKAQLMSRL